MCVCVTTSSPVKISLYVYCIVAFMYVQALCMHACHISLNKMP